MTKLITTANLARLDNKMSTAQQLDAMAREQADANIAYAAQHPATTEEARQVYQACRAGVPQGYPELEIVSDSPTLSSTKTGDYAAVNVLNNETCSRTNSELDPYLEVTLANYAKVYRVEVVAEDGDTSLLLDGVTIDVGGVKCQTEVQSPDPGGKKQVTCNGIGRTVRITRPGVDKQLGLCGIKVFGDAVEDPSPDPGPEAPRITWETETNIEYACHCTCGKSSIAGNIGACHWDASDGAEKGCYAGYEADCNKELSEHSCNNAQNIGGNNFCSWQPSSSAHCFDGTLPIVESNRNPPPGYVAKPGSGPCQCGGSGFGLKSCGELCCEHSPYTSTNPDSEYYYERGSSSRSTGTAVNLCWTPLEVCASPPPPTPSGRCGSDFYDAVCECTNSKPTSYCSKSGWCGTSEAHYKNEGARNGWSPHSKYDCTLETGVCGCKCGTGKGVHGHCNFGWNADDSSCVDAYAVDCTKHTTEATCEAEISWTKQACKWTAT
jgi:hypothetical protein